MSVLNVPFFPQYLLFVSNIFGPDQTESVKTRLEDAMYVLTETPVVSQFELELYCIQTIQLFGAHG